MVRYSLLLLLVLVLFMVGGAQPRAVATDEQGPYVGDTWQCRVHSPAFTYYAESHHLVDDCRRLHGSFSETWSIGGIALLQAEDGPAVGQLPAPGAGISLTLGWVDEADNAHLRVWHYDALQGRVIGPTETSAPALYFGTHPMTPIFAGPGPCQDSCACPFFSAPAYAACP